MKTLVRGRGIIDGYGLLIDDRRILAAAAHEELEGTAVAGNPLEDIRAVHEVVAVAKEGRLLRLGD